LDPVKQIRLYPGISLRELLSEMRETGVLGAGRLGKSVELVVEMFKDPDCTVFLTLAGPLVPAGLRVIISGLIKRGWVDVIVTTGANMVHDMVEAIGHKHYKGSFYAEDEVLKRDEVGRIGDIYVEQKAFEDLERWLHKILDDIPELKKGPISISKLLEEIGRRIEDPDSILKAAADNGVPIISPGFLDSIVGFQLWIAWQDKKVQLDPFLDLTVITDKVFEAKKSGIIILGGGYPKHFGLFANTFRDGVDLAVQITMDRPEPGGLSGAPLEEAISWGKLKPEGKAVTLICDAVIAFPIIIAAAMEAINEG